MAMDGPFGAPRRAPVPAAAAPDEALGSRRTIPYDYAFDFDLRGEPDRVVRSTVTVSVESEFWATAIGYGISAQASSFVFGAQVSDGGAQQFSDIRLGQVLDTLDQATGDTIASDAVLMQGFRLNPAFAEILLPILRDKQIPVPVTVQPEMFQVVSAPAGEVQFRYALFDSATGREFQSAPILNTAGLGTSSGERPFRQFATPIRFAPRTQIRMEVTEVSLFSGHLQVVLHGFKTLGAAGSPTATGRTRRRLHRG